MNTLGSRYVQLLQGQPDPNNGTIYGGLASALQKGMMGYAMGQDERLEKEKQGRLTQALQMYSGSPGNTITWNQPTRVDGTGAPTTTYGAQAPDPMGAARSLSEVYPELSFSMMQAEMDRQRQAEAANNELMEVPNPNGDGTMIFQNRGAVNAGDLAKPPEVDMSSGMKEYNLAVDQGFNGSFVDYKNVLAAAGAANTEVNYKLPPQETAFEKKVGEMWATRYDDVLNAADAASSANYTLDQMEAFLDSGVETGYGAQTKLALDSAALSLGDMFGFDLGIDPANVGQGQAFQALGNRLALELRNPDAGLGMPGAMSDPDREFLVKSVPGLAQTPEGNRILIAITRAMGDRKIAIARLADQYIAENGTFNSGFNDFLRQNLGSQPVVSAEIRNAVANLGAGSDSTGAPAAPPEGVSDAAEIGKMFRAPTTSPSGQPTGSGVPVPPGIDPEAWKFMTPENKQLWQK